MFNNGLYPYMNYGNKAGLFSALKKINWGNFLTTTQKTLGVINQAIPIAYQVKPIWNNTKTIFKIMGAIKNDGKDTKTFSTSEKNKSTNINKTIPVNNSAIQHTTNKPNFFL